MATVVIIVKLMPDSPSADLNLIKSTAKSLLEKGGAKNISIEEKPIAFGLKSMHVKLDFPEDKGTDIVESILSKIEHVSSVTIEDYRRAFGWEDLNIINESKCEPSIWLNYHATNTTTAKKS